MLKWFRVVNDAEHKGFCISQSSGRNGFPGCTEYCTITQQLRRYYLYPVAEIILLRVRISICGIIYSVQSTVCTVSSSVQVLVYSVVRIQYSMQSTIRLLEPKAGCVRSTEYRELLMSVQTEGKQISISSFTTRAEQGAA